MTTPRFSLPFIDNCTYSDATELLKVYGSPLYVYDLFTFKEKIERMKSLCAYEYFQLRYAMKACPSQALLRAARAENVFIDAGSFYEVKRALAAGYKGEEIQLSSQELPPTDAEFKEIVGEGVLFTACSLHQLKKFGELFPGAEVGIRLNLGIRSGEFNRTSVAGPTASFGIWHEYIDTARDIAEKTNIKIARLHQHVGVGVDLSSWSQTVRAMIEVAKAISSVHTVNFGGGFKVDRMNPQSDIDSEPIKEILDETQKNFRADTGRSLQFELEPGTYLTAQMGVLLSEVIDVVDTGSNGHHFIKLNSGMTEVIRPMMYGAQHPLTLLQQEQKTENKEYIVVGHCCESGDLFTPKDGNPEELAPRALPVASVGDIMLVSGVGGYCSSMSTAHYNSFPRAAEVLIKEDGTAQLIRKREQFEDVWRLEV